MISKAISKGKKLLQNKAVSGTIIVAVSSLVASVFSYLVQIFLGRNLTVAEYGIFNTLLSVSVIIGILNTTFNTSVVKLVSNLKVKEKFDTLTHLFVKMSLFALGIGVVFAVLIYILKVPLANFLNISDTTIIGAFAIAMMPLFLKIPPMAYLQGLLRFKGYGFFSIVNAAIRLVVVVIVVYFGYRVGGVLIAMGVGGIVGYFVGVLVLNKNFKVFDKGADLNSYYRKILSFAGPVLFVQVGMILLNNIDIILVKHLFDEYSAGLYSGLVTVAKVFLFAANTVVIVMFPQISEAYAKGENAINKVKPFFILQVFVIIIGLVIFKLFPGLIVDVMFGDEYLEIVKYLPKFTLFFAFYVLLNFFTLFLLAIEKTKVYLLQIPALFLQAALIFKFHYSLDAVINVNLIVSGLLLLTMAIFTIFKLQEDLSIHE